jgi:hypothetical protein
MQHATGLLTTAGADAPKADAIAGWIGVGGANA